MIRRTFIGLFFALPSAVSPALAHTAQAAPHMKAAAASGPNADLFIGYWKDIAPRRLYGALEVRDLLTRSLSK